jgi:hypothetical protein
MLRRLDRSRIGYTYQLQVGLPVAHNRRDGSVAVGMSETLLAFRPGILNRDGLGEAALSTFPPMYASHEYNVPQRESQEATEALRQSLPYSLRSSIRQLSDTEILLTAPCSSEAAKWLYACVTDISE